MMPTHKYIHNTYTILNEPPKHVSFYTPDLGILGIVTKAAAIDVNFTLREFAEKKLLKYYNLW